MQTLFLIVTLFPITAPDSKKAWSPTLQLLPMRTLGNTCANAQMRVPGPTSSDSTNAAGWKNRSLISIANPRHGKRFERGAIADRITVAQKYRRTSNRDVPATVAQRLVGRLDYLDDPQTIPAVGLGSCA
jgi:hypothetical protein